MNFQPSTKSYVYMNDYKIEKQYPTKNNSVSKTICNRNCMVAY